jgi:predicted nucleic acid-binding protein
LTYILDSWALMAWLKGQAPASRRVRELLEDAAAGRVRLIMSMINVGEVYYLLTKSGQGQAAEEFLHDLGSAMPIELHLPDRDCILEAARLKGKYPISYADAFAAATALLHDAPLVTGDPELRTVAGLELEWI